MSQDCVNRENERLNKAEKRVIENESRYDASSAPTSSDSRSSVSVSSDNDPGTPRLAAWPFPPTELIFLGGVVAAFAAWDLTGFFAVAPLEYLIERFVGPTGTSAGASTSEWIRVIGEAIVFGTILPQTTIIGIWSSLADGSTSLRILVTSLIIAIGGSLIGSFWQARGFLGFNNSSSSAAFTGQLYLMALLFGLQLPLFILRITPGWRVVSADSTYRATIRKRGHAWNGLYGYFVFFALLMWSIRVSHNALPNDHFVGSPVTYGNLISLLVLAPICSLCAVRFLVMLNDKPVRGAVIRFLISMPVVALVVTFGFQLAKERGVHPHPPSAPIIFTGVLVTQFFAVTIGFATLFAARRFGMRLVTHRHQLPS